MSFRSLISGSTADIHLHGRSRRIASIGSSDSKNSMGFPRGGKTAAIAYTLIETAKLNDVDPQAWLTDGFGRIADHKITKLDELMPWSYTQH